RFTVRSSATQSLPFYIRRGSSVGLTTGQVSLGTVSAVANTTQEVVFQFTTTASAWDADAAGLTIGASAGTFSPGSTRSEERRVGKEGWPGWARAREHDA